MITYLKCAWANAFTRIGYIFLLLSLVDILTHQYVLLVIELALASALLLGSMFGRGTYVMYRKTKKHMRLHNGLQPWFFVLSMTSGYCASTGMLLALREAIKELRKKEARP